MVTFDLDQVRRNAEADAMTTCLDTCYSMRETFEIDSLDADPVVATLAQERLRGVDAVIERRERLRRLQTGTSTRRDRDRETWLELSRRVKDLISVPTVLEYGGIPVVKVGNEYHSPCPVCQDGVDRLVSWDGPNSRYWCRRCGTRGDVIAAAQSLIPSVNSFHEAVRWLAELAGVTMGGR